MRLGFDLDGTVADLRNELALEAVRLFPDVDLSAVPQSPPHDASPASAEADEVSAGEATAEQVSQASARSKSIRTLSARQQRQIWKAACDREDFWESLD